MWPNAVLFSAAFPFPTSCVLDAPLRAILEIQKNRNSKKNSKSHKRTTLCPREPQKRSTSAHTICACSVSANRASKRNKKIYHTHMRMPPLTILSSPTHSHAPPPPRDPFQLPSSCREQAIFLSALFPQYKTTSPFSSSSPQYARNNARPPPPSSSCVLPPRSVHSTVVGLLLVSDTPPPTARKTSGPGIVGPPVHVSGLDCWQGAAPPSFIYFEYAVVACTHRSVVRWLC